MNRTELVELIHNGENSGVEFKRDDSHPNSIAREMSALAQLRGWPDFVGRGRRR